MGALLALLPSLLSTVSKFIPDPAAQAQANIELTKVITEQQNAIYDEMSKVMVADAASEGWMTRNARPFVVFWCIGMITLDVIAALFGHGPAVNAALAGVPGELWSLASYGIGAYILGKSGVDVAKALKK